MDPSHVALSHVDKVVDRGYLQALLETGAFAEFDGSFRWGDDDNGTLTSCSAGPSRTGLDRWHPPRHGRGAAGLLRA